MPINLKGVKASAGPLVKGKYPLEIIEGVSGESEVNKTPYIRFTLSIFNNEYEGRKVEKDFWLTEKAYPILVRFMKATGVDTDRDFEEPEAIIDECLKKRLIGDISINDRGYPSLDDFLPLNSKGKKSS